MAAQQSSRRARALHDTIYELFASTEPNLERVPNQAVREHEAALGARSKLDAETKSFIWQTLAVISFVAFVFLLTLKIRFNNVFLRFLGTIPLSCI